MSRVQSGSPQLSVSGGGHLILINVSWELSSRMWELWLGDTAREW